MNSSITFDSDYPPREEFWNAFTHAIGVVFGITVLVLMLVKAVGSEMDLSGLQITGVALYGSSLILMFLSSTLYHTFANTRAKFVLKRIDHSAIYALIAGTYTPIVLIGINSPKALFMFWALWTVAVLGVIFKIFFIHRFERLSLFVYLAMGWASVLVLRDLYVYLDRPALWLIVTGGLLYSIGTIFYASKSIRYAHAIWHGFVFAAATCHALAIWLYVV